MRVRTAVLLAFASLTLIGASRPLNPLVPRMANENAVRLAECAEGAAPAPMPRIEVADLPDLPEPPVTAPPSSGLRTQLRDAQTALTRDDRPSFDAALARARNTLSDYPAGGEKNAAQNVVRVYEDVAVLWDAQFSSPFFGEESAAYRAANGYSGWSEAIRRQILVDDRDRRFYPARESRQFLATVAATRLERLGVKTPSAASPRVVEREDPNAALPSVQPRRRPGKVETHASAEPRRSSTPRSSASRSSSSTSRSSTRSSTPSSASSSAPPRSTATPKPSPVRTATPAPTPVIPPPVREPAPPSTTIPTETVATETSSTETSSTETSSPIVEEPPSATDTMMTETTATTDSVAPATDSTATTATVSEPEPVARKRNLVIPLLLILVGIGVLIVLFRTST